MKKILTPQEFLYSILERSSLIAPDGRILYKYQLRRPDYDELRKSLKYHNYLLEKCFISDYWSSAFCLYISEWYRRDYDGRWSWNTCEEQLDIDITPNQRSKIVSVGLSYWKRPIHKQLNTGNDYLGTLFFEGGLPWPKIKHDSTFGSIIKRCLSDYYNYGYDDCTITEIVYSHRYSLPQVFQNEESLMLIVSIIDSLRLASDTIKESVSVSPYEEITKKNPAWIHSFPLPLDDITAQDLVSEWLVDAKEKQASQKNQTNTKFLCSHSLKNNDWFTTIHFPAEVILPNMVHQIQNTRFEMILYEGNSVVSHEGVLYGQINNSDIELFLHRNPKSFIRKNPNSSLFVKYYSAGTLISQNQIEDSLIDQKGMIVLAPSDEDTFDYVSNASCFVKNNEAVIQYPLSNDWRIDPKPQKRIGLSKKWIRVKITSDSSIINKTEKFKVRLNSDKASRKYYLEGRQAGILSNVSTCYYGFPRLPINMVDDRNTLLMNRESFSGYNANDYIGNNTISLVSQDGNILFRKHIGILPKDFEYQAIPKIHTQPARIIFPETEGVEIRIKQEGLNIEQQENVFSLYPINGVIPDNLVIYLKGYRSETSIRLYLPYPREEVILFDNNTAINESVLHIDRLLGLSLIIHTLDAEENVHLSLTLESKKIKKKYSIAYRYQTKNHYLQLGLFSLRGDIIKLFSIVADQDARVILKLDNDTANNLITVLISQFDGDINWECGKFSIQNFNKQVDHSTCIPIAMNIADPSQKRKVQPLLSEGVETGRFFVDSALEKGGPWLIIPDQESKIVFRPRIYIPSKLQKEVSKNVNNDNIVESLHTAARVFDGKNNDTIIEVVERMASDYNHSGWLYLRALIDSCSHIPLSSFEVWLVIANNPLALTSAIFRLELGEMMCHKIVDELAIIWETIQIECWIKAYEKYREYLNERQLPEDLVNEIISKRVRKLKKLILVFEHFWQVITQKKIAHDNTGNENLASILKEWANALRIDNKDRHFLNHLKTELEFWKDKCCKSPVDCLLYNYPDEMKSTLYLPFFMAECTFGSTSLDAFDLDQKEAQYLIKNIMDFDRRWYEPAWALILASLLDRQVVKENQ